MVVVVVMMWMIPVVVVPTPVPAIPVVWTIPVVIVIIPRVPRAVMPIIGIVIITVRVESPVPGIADINVGVAAVIAVACVIVVVVVHGGGGSSAETLDAGCKVGIVIGFGGGVNHTVGISHGFGGLVHGIHVGLVVLAIGIISLIVVGRAVVDTRSDTAAIVVGILRLWIVVRRIIGVIVGHPLVG